MTTLAVFDGAGLADGLALAAGTAGTNDSPVASVSAAPPVVDVDDVPHGRPNERAIITDNNAAASMAYFSLGGSKTQARARGYFKTPAAWPSSAISDIAAFCASNLGRRAGLVVAGSGQPGQLRLIAGSSTNLVTSANNTLALSTWYRYEFWVSIESSTSIKINCRIYDMAGNVLWAPTEAVGNPNGADVQMYQFGVSATTAKAVMPMAHLKITDDIATEIGAWYVAPPSVGKAVRQLVAGVETARVMRVYNGTSEVPVTLG